jgi:glyoxylase-like metal-dependent hydrolase (beta-lactamase superfamily II)
VSQPVALRPLADWVVNVERDAPGEPGVRSTVLLGERYTVVFDTLYSPRDMAPVSELADRRRRPVLVVNSHADYDHVWGNGAFPLASIVGHEACRERFLDDGDVAATLRRLLPESPEEYSLVVLRPPDVTFSERLAIDAGGFSIVLHHLPGHKRDCIVAHVPEHGLLLGGDTIEDPIPLLDDGPLGAWSAALRAWAARTDVHTVIPSHGPVSGTELLVRNADYLDSLRDGPAGWEPPPDAAPFYERAHARNVRRAADLTA